jgi:hypothetical protein
MANWKAVGGVCRWSGDVSPEQVSDYWDMRCEDWNLGAQVTSSWYVVQRDGVYRVEKQTEYLIARDLNQPGATEEWSDVVYDLCGGVYGGVPDAERAAEQLAREYDPGDIDWDGHRP